MTCLHQTVRGHSQHSTPERPLRLVWCSLANKILGSTHGFPETWCNGCARTPGDPTVKKIVSVAKEARKPRPMPDCPYRGPQVGVRHCATCGNMQPKEFLCDLYGAPVIAKECQNCPGVQVIQPTIAVIVVAHNEGPEVIETVRSMWDANGIDEIIVADDASTDGSTDEFADRKKHTSTLPPIRLLRMDKRIGCNPCRNIAARRSPCDVLVLMDAHMRISGQCLRRLGRAAKMLKGIVQAANRGMPLTTKMHGRGVEWRETDENLFELKWATREPTAAYGPSDGVMGACYAIPRDIFERLGGFMDNTGLWGFTEGVLTLKANLAEVPIYVSRDIFARHLYRGREGQPPQPFKVPSNHPWMSRCAGLKITLEPSTFERILPDLKAKRWDAEIESLLARPALQAEHEHFQKARKISDAAFFERYLPTLAGCWTGPIGTTEEPPDDFYVNGVKQPGGMAGHYGAAFK